MRETLYWISAWSRSPDLPYLLFISANGIDLILCLRKYSGLTVIAKERWDSHQIWFTDLLADAFS